MTTNYILTSDGSFISKDSLYHHGIKGMKWGVRRDQNKDSALTSTGRKQVNEEDETRRRKIKKAIKIGAVLAGTALAAYGGYKLSQYVKNKKSSSKLARKLLEESLSAAKPKPITEVAKSTVKSVASDSIKSTTVPRVEVDRSSIPRTNVYGRNDFESLRKANADLFNKTLDDLLKGL